MKKLLCIMLLFAMSLLVGCSEYKTAAEVPLASQEEMDEYVWRCYGQGEPISKDIEGHCIIYTYKDKELGFQYTIKSFASPVLFDQCTIGYSEKKSTDFPQRYGEYMLGGLDEEIKSVEEEFGVKIEFCDYERTYDTSLTPIRITVNENMVSVLTRVGEVINEADVKDFFRELDVLDIAGGEDRGDYLGRLYFATNRFVPREEPTQPVTSEVTSTEATTSGATSDSDNSSEPTVTPVVTDAMFKPSVPTSETVDNSFFIKGLSSEVVDVSIIDATEPVDPKYLWYINTRVAFDTIDVISASNESLTLMYHDNGVLISNLVGVLNEADVGFVPECTRFKDGKLMLTSIKVYDSAGKPIVGLSTLDGIKSWFDDIRAKREVEYASAENLPNDTVKVSQLVENKMYKVKSTAVDIINDTGEAYELLVFDDRVNRVLLPAFGLDNGCSSYTKPDYLKPAVSGQEGQYIKLVPSNDLDVLKARAIAQEADCLTISELKNNERNMVEDFLYNDTGSDVTLVYPVSSDDIRSIVLKPDDIVSYNNIDYWQIEAVGNEEERVL